MRVLLLLSVWALTLLNVRGDFNWLELGADIHGEGAGDYSGLSVSLSSDGNTVAIGAPGNVGAGSGAGSRAGHVRVYRFVSGWTQLGADIDGEAAGDYSGTSVSLSSDGNTVAIGAPRHDHAGHVRVYRFVSGVWTQHGADIDGEAGGDYSGISVSLSSDGNTVTIGAPFNDGIPGRVQVHRFVSGVWTQLGADIIGEERFDHFGFSVSISSDGNTVAIGASLDGGAGFYAGCVRVYRFVSGSWAQLGADIDGEAADDNFGTSVSLSSDGNTVAIGAPGNDGAGDNAGHVRVYRFVSGVWTQLGADIDGEAAGDQSGNSVSLSSDGTTVAISAPLPPRRTGLGYVRVYRFVSGNTKWTQLGVDINGEAFRSTIWLEHLYGATVTLSSDGNTVAIGLPFNDDVRVFRLGDGPAPSKAPTLSPTRRPTPPTLSPTLTPTSAPTFSPTSFPTQSPTSAPTLAPTLFPTLFPTISPTPPTSAPTLAPTLSPTLAPTLAPTPGPPFIVTWIESDIGTSVGAVLLGIVLFFIWWRSGDIGLYEITLTWFALVDFSGDVLYIMTQPFDSPELFYTSVALLFLPPLLFALGTWRLWLKLAVSGVSSILGPMLEFSHSLLLQIITVGEKVLHADEMEENESSAIKEVFSFAKLPEYEHYDKPFKLLHLGGVLVLNVTICVFQIGFLVVAAVLHLLFITLVTTIGLVVLMLVVVVNLSAILVFLVLLAVGIFLAVNLKITVAPSLQRRLEAQNEGEEKRSRSPFFFNLSVFVEVLGESIPQLVIISINSVLVGEKNGVFYFAVIGSGLAIIYGVYFYLYWWCKLGSLWKALRVDPREDAKDTYMSEGSEISAQMVKQSVV